MTYESAMASELSSLSAWFWDDTFWLPPNVTWAHLTNSRGQNGVNYRVVSDLWYPIPTAFVVILIRSVVERYFSISNSKL